MRLKEFLFRRGIKQVDIVRGTGVDPCRLSLHINGIKPLPESKQISIATYLGISPEEFRANIVTTTEEES